MNLYFGLILMGLIICGIGDGIFFYGKEELRIFVIMLLFVIWIILLVYIYFKFFSKNNKIMVKRYGYYREIVDNYGPEVLGYLLTHKKIKTEYLIASIMELVRRKIFVVFSKDDGSFIIKDNDINNEKSMSISESYLKNWLINSLGNGKEFNSNDLYISSDNIEKKKIFDSSFKEWSKLVIELGKKENFYNDKISINNSSIGMFILINFGIIYYLLGIFVNTEIGGLFFIAIIFLILSISIIILSMVSFDFYSEKRTLKGNEEYFKWMGFRNFILNYSEFQSKDVEDVYLWEKYLVYASVLGITDDINFKFDINDIGISIDEDHPLLVFQNVLQRRIGLLLSNYKK